MKKKKLYFIRAALIILTAALAVVIFALSADNADESNAKSNPIRDSFVYRILSSFELSDEQIEKVISSASFIVRKTAHFCEYALLGFLTAGICVSFYKREIFTFFISWLAGSIYAVTDEIHQYFVPGRSCQVSDMALDACGVAAGAAFMLLCVWIFRKTKNKKALRKCRH